MASVTIKKFIEDFDLEVLLEGEEDKLITVNDVNRPGLQLAGFYNYFTPERLQVIGKAEWSFLEDMKAEVRKKRLKKFFSYENLSCIVISRHLEPHKELIEAAKNKNIWGLRSNLSTTKLVTNYTMYMADNLAPETRNHGVLMDVYGVETKLMTLEEAKKTGAMALFDDKYGDKVRVVAAGEFSKELCGGTHVSNVGEIGLFKIVAETGVAAGIRRIEAVTGIQAIKFMEDKQRLLREACAGLKCTEKDILKKISSQNAELKEKDKEIAELKSKLTSGAEDDILNSAKDINGVKTVAYALEDVDGNALRDLADKIRNKMGSGVVVLVSKMNDKVNLVAMSTKDVLDKGVHCGNIVKSIAQKLDIYCLVVHPIKEAYAVCDGKLYHTIGPYEPNPKLTTGAGDNFNAGFCFGQVLGLSVQLSLLLGVATSGYYVRNSKSPTLEDIINFLENWRKNFN